MKRSVAHLRVIQGESKPAVGYVDAVFGVSGVLAGKFDGYAPRAGQVGLSEEIAACLKNGGSLLAEAPTGTGKSFAYLVPATYHAAGEPGADGMPTRPTKRTIVVTANIALQEQVVEKDLPFLRESLPWGFTFAMAKGKANYLCLERFDETANEVVMGTGGMINRAQWDKVVEWRDTTETGDVSELPFEGPIKAKFTTTSDECLGRKCPQYSGCFAERARAAVKEAQVVVTNYHMFFTNLVLREATGRNVILPDYDYVIFDEGHKAADIARDFFGFKVTAGSIRWAARLLGGGSGIPPINPDLKAELTTLADDFFGALRVFRANPARYKARLRVKNAVDSSRLVAGLEKAAAAYRERMSLGGLNESQAEKVRIAASRMTTLAANIGAAMNLSDRDSVYFLEEDREHRVTLASKPISVAAKLREAVFEPRDAIDEQDGGEGPGARQTSAIVLSATLTTTPGDFEWIAEELGAEGARTFVAESPFDLTEQMRCVVPIGSVPLPSDRGFHAAVASTVRDVVTRAKGRTLSLHTSYKALNLTCDELQGTPYQILRHGDAPRTQLIAEFKRDVSSVLVGTESFWAGVDVPGEALSVVVIDRLPFPSPDDPICDAIEDRTGRSFFDYSVPRAIIAFRQGVGRLIRATSDRGVVVVLDRRLIDKGYGKQFVKALGAGVKLSRQLDEITEFLGD